VNRAEDERLGRVKQLSLTTFKCDGTAVSTPVWVARDGDELVVITDATSGKAKRIRNIGRVEVAPCDVRGRITGSTTSGQARLLDSTGTEHVAAQIKRKYGLQYAAIGWMEKLRRRPSSGSVGIRIDLDEAAGS